MTAVRERHALASAADIITKYCGIQCKGRDGNGHPNAVFKHARTRAECPDCGAWWHQQKPIEEFK